MHGIEMRKLTSGEIGSFVASREAGWHRLGHVADEDLTVEQAIKLLNPGEIVKSRASRARRASRAGARDRLES